MWQGARAIIARARVRGMYKLQVSTSLVKNKIYIKSQEILTLKYTETVRAVCAFV